MSSDIQASQVYDFYTYMLSKMNKIDDVVSDSGTNYYYTVYKEI